MAKITNTSDSDLVRNYDGKWRESYDAKMMLPGRIGSNCESSAPQSDVDAIAAAMDAQEMEASNPIQGQQMPVLGDATDLPVQDLNPSKDQVINTMMQNYIQQNGSIVVDNQDQTLFG